MSSEESTGKRFVEYANWPGVFTGILMLVLPFLGPWWDMKVGEGIFELSVSPFHYQAGFMGEAVIFPFLNYLLPALQILLFIGGVFMVAGSFFVDKKWSRRLIKFGFRKVFWPFVTFVVVLLLGSFLVNNFLVGSMPGLPSEQLGSIQNSIEIQVPYILGTGTVEIEAKDITASVPITFSIDPVFWVALLAVVLGVFSSRFYPRMVG